MNVDDIKFQEIVDFYKNNVLDTNLLKQELRFYKYKWEMINENERHNTLTKKCDKL